jgi:hypothetical protein
MKSTGDERMPNIGTHVVDELGVNLVESWILAMDACP